MHRASCRFMPLCGITETLSDVESVRVVHETRRNIILYLFPLMFSWKNYIMMV